VTTKHRKAAEAGNRTDSSGKLVGNKILLSMLDAEFQKIRRHLEFLDLPNHQTLHHPHKKQHYLYFLNRGLASIVVATRGGRDVEAGVVGCEGSVGTAITVGLDKSPLRLVMQITGDAFRVSARALLAALPDTPDLQMRLHRYAVLQGMQVAQTAACNRLHQVEQRLARWLLMAQDRVGGAALQITHDFLATMLGTDRPSVSLAAAALQRSEAIMYRRSSVQIVNRKKLEASACECYRVVRHLNGHLGLR